MSPCRLLAAAALFSTSLFAADADQFCIAGQVVNGSTGEPLRHAAVTIPQSATLTDAAGTFRFCGLQPGAYYANAEKPGFAASGQLVPVGPSREDVALRLQPLGIVHGVVLDRDNQPLENALIQVLSATTEAGYRKVRLEASAISNDRGEYRLPNLRPGRYYLRAAGWQAPPAKDAGARQTFAPTYYGGSTEIASATPVTLEAGRDLTADFTVTLESAYAVRGTVTGYSSQLPLQVELIRPEEGLSSAPVNFDPLTGVFQAANVAPGSYIIRATQGDGDQRTRGELPVQVSASDVNDLVVTMAGAVTLKGIVRTTAASGNTPAPPACSVELSALGMVATGESRQASTENDLAALAAGTGAEFDEKSPSTPPAADRNNNEFELAGVLPGRYRIRLDCAGGYVASARAGDTDLLAHNELVISAGVQPPPLEILVNTDGGTVDVTAAKDNADVSAWLVLLPDSGSDLHVRFGILKGKASFAGVAPGDYHAYAWTGSPYAFEYADPAARQLWANHSVSVHVAERDHAAITANIAPEEQP